MKYLTSTACAFFCLFVASRAIHVALTYDEAASYIRYIDATAPSVFDTHLLSIFNFEVATNHFLNTVLTKVCNVVAGGAEFPLRLPNLLGYALYLGFGVLILRRLSNRLIAFSGFLLLNLDPYLLDFFALSRGYGLALGLLMGSLFFLLRFLDRRIAGRTNAVDLSRALAFACGAVVANFALLNVYVSIAALATAAAVWANTRAGRSPAQPRELTYSTWAWPWWLVTAALFIPLVLSQDTGLSSSLYEPMVVRLIGVPDNALDRARVARIDIRGRTSLLARNGDAGGWSSNAPVHFRGLRIELPRDDAQRLTRIETVIGVRAFSLDPRLTDVWTTSDVGDMRVFESAPTLSLQRSHVAAFRSVINWAGDRLYAVRLAIASASALGILCTCALLLRLIGWSVVRANIVEPSVWRTLSSSALWVGALTGTPLYLLKRNAELYFGGTRGIVPDTFTSVIENSFYGSVYSDVQVPVVFACVAGMFLTFCVLAAMAYRRGRLSSLFVANSLLMILLITSFSLIAQRVIFHTVYLVGRTALFYVPLCVLFSLFVCDRLAQTGRTAKVLANSIVIAAVVLASFHFAHSANLKYAYDWKDDASTKIMIEDVGRFVGARPHSSAVVVGVAPAYAPVALYYTRRSSPGSIDVVVVPSTRTIDFLYTEERDIRSGDIVSRYPFTRTALARVTH